MKKWILAVLAIGLLGVGMLIVNTMRLKPPLLEAVPTVDFALSDSVWVRLAQAIQIPTVSHADTNLIDYSTFDSLFAHIQRSYPLTVAKLEREPSVYPSLLFRWPGQDPKLKPIALLAHLDVVPIENPDAWQVPPFSGRIDDEFVHGRGSLDDKQAVFGILEAVERLLTEGFQPRQTVYLAFGHDEEILGQGARRIVDFLTRQNVRLEYVLDEGMVIVEDMLDGVEPPIALIGLSEKGFASVQLTAHGEGGHSSMPPARTAVFELAEALTRLRDRPFDAQLNSAVAGMFERLAPEMDFGQRLVFANRRLFAPLIIRELEKGKSTNAIVRTTTAPTMLTGSQKDNVLPARAEAVVNFRVLPGERVEGVLAQVAALTEGLNVDVELVGNWSDPPPLSSPRSAGYRAIERSVRACFPGVLVAPSMSVATTDARHYSAVADDVYRFTPLEMKPDDLARIHGRDERIGRENYKRLIRFYYHLLNDTRKTETER